MEHVAAGFVPEWTLGDRLRKAREHAGLKQSELAAEIGISRASIVNYETGRYDPSRPVVLSWALRCGVALEWLDPSRRAAFPAAALRFDTSVTKPRGLALAA